MPFVNESLPSDFLLSFKKLVDFYLEDLNSQELYKKVRAEKVKEIIDENPEFLTGIDNIETIGKLRNEIDFLLEDLFPKSLLEREIKVAAIPYYNIILKSSEGLKNVIAAAGEGFSMADHMQTNDLVYRKACLLILTVYYGYDLNYLESLSFSIPNAATGVPRHFRMTLNADMLEIEKKDATPEISEAKYLELIQNFDDFSIWKKMFPPNGYTIKGFAIGNLFDYTEEFAISEFKSKLLDYQPENETQHRLEPFLNIFKTIFNLKEIEIGYSIYNPDDEVLEKCIPMPLNSYILNNHTSKSCEEALCDLSFKTMIEDGNYFVISSVKNLFENKPEELFYTTLLSQKIGSAIFAPIKKEDKLIGIVELVSSDPYALNQINAKKFEIILPQLVERISHDAMKFEDEIDLTIQKECTSIHPSVYWKFRKQARLYNFKKLKGEQIAFNDIRFKDVYPLYGQSDIKGSSNARNNAVIEDLRIELEALKGVFEIIIQKEKLPIYDHYLFKINEYLECLIDGLKVDLEFIIKSFFEKELHPVLDIFRSKKQVANKISAYEKLLDPEKGVVYKHRKKYDHTVNIINKRLAAFLDEKQKNAQEMLPHYFEKFKSDGVEHSIYIGSSINKDNNRFSPLYLNNIRLWQIETIWAMENEFNNFRNDLEIPLEVASMILVNRDPLTIKFRMDEKRFDVDGTYNARYEVIKKRVDKALIKNTNERITQSGKLAIVYSNPDDELEYIEYIKSFQAKGLFAPKIEKHILEDMQGVTGMKALRVDLLFTKSIKEAIKDVKGVTKSKVTK